MLARRPGALSDAELLAILVRTGIAGKGVLQMAEDRLQIKNDSVSRNTDGRQGGFGGIAGLLHATADDLKRVKDLGPAKRAEIVAVMELARRAMAQRLQEREVFAVLFLESQTKMLAMEELFRGTLTQLSVTLLRKYFGWFRHFTAPHSEIRYSNSGLWRQAGYAK